VLKGKKREVHQREQLFLDVAAKVLLEEGYPEVSINRVAESTGFSRGTVYQRFKSKEELVTALGLQCRGRLHDAVTRAIESDGRPRERLVGIGEAISCYVKQYPDDQRVLKIIDSELILQRVGEEQRARMAQYDIHMFEHLAAIIMDAVQQEDLVLRDGATPQGLCFAFWAMMDGAFAASMGGAPLEEVGIVDPIAEVIRNCHYLLDGYGWHPLSSEWDYDTASARIREELGFESAATDGSGTVVSYAYTREE